MSHLFSLLLFCGCTAVGFGRYWQLRRRETLLEQGGVGVGPLAGAAVQSKPFHPTVVFRPVPGQPMPGLDLSSGIGTGFFPPRIPTAFGWSGCTISASPPGRTGSAGQGWNWPFPGWEEAVPNSSWICWTRLPPCSRKPTTKQKRCWFNRESSAGP